jgi:hypothetical protein
MSGRAACGDVGSASEQPNNLRYSAWLARFKMLNAVHSGGC